MKRVQEDFNLKEENIEAPGVYIGATLAKLKLDSGKYCCTMFPEQYVKAAVTYVEEDLSRSGKRFPSKCATSLLMNYAPWLEDFLELIADGVQQYQEFVGHLRWAVEIGRLYILLETLMLLSYLAMP